MCSVQVQRKSLTILSCVIQHAPHTYLHFMLHDAVQQYFTLRILRRQSPSKGRIFQLEFISIQRSEAYKVICYYRSSLMDFRGVTAGAAGPSARHDAAAVHTEAEPQAGARPGDPGRVRWHLPLPDSRHQRRQGQTLYSPQL